MKHSALFWGGAENSKHVNDCTHHTVSIRRAARRPQTGLQFLRKEFPGDGSRDHEQVRPEPTQRPAMGREVILSQAGLFSLGIISSTIK